MNVSLNDVSQFHCGECDETFELSEVKALIAGWLQVIQWIEQAPERK